MMEARKKIIIFGGIVFFLVLLVLVAFLFLKNKSAPVAEKTPIPTSIPESIPEENTRPVPIIKNTVPPPPATTEEREKLFIKQLARTFVERFETSSSQNDNRNIVDATELATEKMSQYIESKATPQSSTYTGLTTNVISMDILEFSPTDATVKIGAQVITENSSGSLTSYKNGSVVLKKIEGNWKVDGLFWDPS